MHFIIFDLEATCWPESIPELEQEIIEIGALNIDRYGSVNGSFENMVKPVIHPYLSPYCKELTGISQSEVDDAKTFEEVFPDFYDWMAEDGKFLLCSWGSKDMEFFEHDCSYHDLGTAWTEYYIDLKSQYRDIKSLPEKIGLKQAIRKEGFEFTGDHHRAMTDAKNLSKIFLKYIDEWKY